MSTSDGGIIGVGTARQNSSLGHDIWAVKIDGNNKIVWEKLIRKPGDDDCYSIVKTYDNNFIIGGVIKGMASLLKIDGSGSIVWQKDIMKYHRTQHLDVIESKDHGIVFAGRTSTSLGDIAGGHGGSDICVIKFDEQGNKLWHKLYGGSRTDVAYKIVNTTDGGYLIAGTTQSRDGDFLGRSGIDVDIAIIKIDKDGTKVSQKIFGGSYEERPTSIVMLDDGGFILNAYSRSNDGEVEVNRGERDIWMIKSDINYNIIWDKTVGGSAYDYASSIIPTMDGHFVIAGITRSNDFDFTNNKGQTDVWAFKINTNGSILWKESFGGSEIEEVFQRFETSPNKYAFVGHSDSRDGDIVGAHGNADGWIMRFER